MPQATFVLKEPKSNKPTLVYLVFHFNNSRLKYSTSQKILPKYWNEEKHRAKELRSNPEYANFNFLLDKLETTVNNCYRKLITDNTTPPTPNMLRENVDDVLNRKESAKDFISFASNILEASDRKAVTKKSIRQTLNILKEFKETTKRSIHFDNIDLDFYNDFIDFLSKTKDLRQSTIGNHIKNVKVFMREAFERGLTKNAQFQSKKFRKPFEESESIYLTEKEIRHLYELDFLDNPRLEKVRDLFVVACYTGLRYSDLTQIKIESINKEKNVIKMKTQKTDELILIPMNSIVNRIIKKYSGHLPTAISNHNMNEYLKEIGEIAGMNDTVERVATKGGKRIREVFKKYELLTVHTARRSFATNAFLQNVPSISIMKITGHKTEKNFLRYIKISQEENATKLLNHPFFIQ